MHKGEVARKKLGVRREKNSNIWLKTVFVPQKVELIKFLNNKRIRSFWRGLVHACMHKFTLQIFIELCGNHDAR